MTKMGKRKNIKVLKTDWVPVILKTANDGNTSPWICLDQNVFKSETHHMLKLEIDMTLHYWYLRFEKTES